MVGVTAKTQNPVKLQNHRKNTKVFLLVVLFFLYVSPVEGIRSLEKGEVVKEKKEKLLAEERLDEAVIENIDSSVVESEILDSIKEFEREKEEIIKEQKLKGNIESPVFKTYIAPLPSLSLPKTVLEKKAISVSKALPKKKHILFDVIFFSIILASFLGIKTLLKPSKS